MHKIRKLRRGTLVSYQNLLTGVIDGVSFNGRAIVALDLPLRIVPLGIELQKVIIPFEQLSDRQ